MEDQSKWLKYIAVVSISIQFKIQFQLFTTNPLVAYGTFKFEMNIHTIYTRHGQSEARGPRAARQKFFAALVANLITTLLIF